MVANGDPIVAKITGNVRSDWNDPTAHLATLDGSQITASRQEAIGIPYYWQRVRDRPRVKPYFYDQKYVFWREGAFEPPWRRMKLWLVRTRFFALYRGRSLNALYVQVEREPGHHHFVCAEYDDLFLEAFDAIARISKSSVLAEPMEQAVEWAKREDTLRVLNEIKRLPRTVEDYLDVHFLKLVKMLGRGRGLLY